MCVCHRLTADCKWQPRVSNHVPFVDQLCAAKCAGHARDHTRLGDSFRYGRSESMLMRTLLSHPQPSPRLLSSMDLDEGARPLARRPAAKPGPAPELLTKPPGRRPFETSARGQPRQPRRSSKAVPAVLNGDPPTCAICRGLHSEDSPPASNKPQPAASCVHSLPEPAERFVLTPGQTLGPTQPLRAWLRLGT